MQLISLPVSPFSARVRIAIYAKALDIEIVPPPPGWPSDRQFKRINPAGRVPVLLLGEGDAIPESSVIPEFLEERFADARPLLPTGEHERARARLLARVTDLYLMPPMVALAGSIEDGRQRRRSVDELLNGFSILDALLDDGMYAVGDELSIADCALAPALFAARVTGERLQLDVIERWPQVRRYAESVEQDRNVARVLAEMEVGLQQLTGGR
jgi:glutathione S-transferase